MYMFIKLGLGERILCSSIGQVHLFPTAVLVKQTKQHKTRGKKEKKGNMCITSDFFF